MSKKFKKSGGSRSLRLEWIEAGTLADNPSNWRRHPEGQMMALKSVLADGEVGWAGALLYNERTGRLIDGHARKEAVDSKTPVPVLIGSWSEEAEKKILLTLDPLAGLAQVDPAALQALMAEVTLEGPDMEGLSASLDALADVPTIDGGDGGDGGNGAPGPERYAVLVECRSEREQTKVVALLSKQGIPCKPVSVSD